MLYRSHSNRSLFLSSGYKSSSDILLPNRRFLLKVMPLASPYRYNAIFLYKKYFEVLECDISFQLFSHSISLDLIITF